MEKRERRTYDQAFKKMVVEIHLSGKSTRTISEELGIGNDLVRRWTREFNAQGVKSFPGNGKQHLSEEQKEVIALKKALADAQLERDILKKAVSIFSRGDSKYTGS